jgi:hypothetical protein
MASNGILDVAPFAELSVLDTIIRNTGGTGIGIAADASVIVDHVRSEHNGFDGFYIVPGASSAKAVITDSIFAWNGANGINVDSVTGATTAVDVERSTLSENGGAGLIANGNAGLESVAVAHSAIHRNAGAGVAVVANTFNGFATISQNSFVDNTVGISANGNFAVVFASANSLVSQFSPDFETKLSAIFCSLQNNAGLVAYSGPIASCPGR